MNISTKAYLLTQVCSQSFASHAQLIPTCSTIIPQVYICKRTGLRGCNKLIAGVSRKYEKWSCTFFCSQPSNNSLLLTKFKLTPTYILFCLYHYQGVPKSVLLRFSAEVVEGLDEVCSVLYIINSFKTLQQ